MNKKTKVNSVNHPSHEAELLRIRRAKGQVQAVENMIMEHRYCVDIVQQIKAARSALRAVEVNILRTHLQACVKQALSTPDAYDADKKLKEISDLLGK